MATTNYSWNLPVVGGSESTWGTQLNANWASIDTLLGGVSQTEFSILDGATVTTAELNQLDGNTFTADIVPNSDNSLDLGSSSAAWAVAYLGAIEPAVTDTTIKRVDGTNSTPIVEGVAKAWVSFNGTGTIAARDSFNVSSLTDVGTGDYTVNVTNAFAAADYSAVSGGRRGVGLSGFASIISAFSTDAFSVRTFDTASVSDWDYVTASTHGDLS